MKAEPVFVNVYGARNRFRQAGNRFLGSLNGFQIRALYTMHCIDVLPAMLKNGEHIQRPNSWTYNLVEASGHNPEISKA